MNGSQQNSVRTPRDLISRVWAVDPDAGAALIAEASKFRPALIVNRVDHPKHQQLGEDMATACREYFGVRLQFLGGLPNDQVVGRSVVEQRLAVEFFPQIPFVTAVHGIVDKLAYTRRRSA